MIHLRTKFHLLSSGGSVVTGIKVKGKENSYMTVIVMFYILQSISPSSSCLFFKVYCQGSYQVPQVSGARVIS
jgi:hypothetical protein